MKSFLRLFANCTLIFLVIMISAHDVGFRIFVKSVFYVGKGRRTRPYAHFKEAMHHISDPQKEVSERNGSLQKQIHILR